jgi:two-component system phosphate regulon response regulator PhoB
MLPGMDGLETCRRIKSDPATRMTLVLMLTARGEEADVVTGLEMGSDDYVIKPFSPRILTARVRAVLRRRGLPPTDKDAPIGIREIEIHPGRHEVRVGGRPVELTFTEFRILHFLAQHPGWVFTRYQIVDAVRGENYPVTERSVDVQIVGLRRKLGPAGKCIETVRGVGYRLKD